MKPTRAAGKNGVEALRAGYMELLRLRASVRRLQGWREDLAEPSEAQPRTPTIKKGESRGSRRNGSGYRD